MKYSDKELLNILQDAEEEIIPLTSDAFDEHSDYPAKVTISRRFGTWSDACKKANVESGQVTRKSILHNIKKYVNSNEISNSEEFFNHPDTTSPATFYEKFNSWREAVDEVDKEAFDHYTKEDVVSSIRKFNNKFGYISQIKFKYTDGYPSSTTASRMFGSWNEAVKAADIEPNEIGVATNEKSSGMKKELFGSNWHTQREKALQRDDFNCRKCKSKENLHIHHIKPRHTYRNSSVFNVEESNILQNLITLCQSCHYSVEAGDNEPTNDYSNRLKPRMV